MGGTGILVLFLAFQQFRFRDGEDPAQALLELLVFSGGRRIGTSFRFHALIITLLSDNRPAVGAQACEIPLFP